MVVATQNHIFFESNIQKTPSRCLNFTFSIDGLSDLNYLQGSVGKRSKQLHYDKIYNRKGT